MSKASSCMMKVIKSILNLSLNLGASTGEPVKNLDLSLILNFEVFRTRWDLSI